MSTSMACSGAMRLFVFTVMTWPVLMLLAVPAFAASQVGPFLVSDRVDSYAIAGEGLGSHQKAVLGVGYGATQSNGVVGVTSATMSYGVQGIASASNGPPSFGVIGSSADGNGIYGSSLSPTWAGIYATNRTSSGIALQAAADGTGVFSSSGNADGIVGQTHAPLPGSGPAIYAGVHGLDVSSRGFGDGVIGESRGGIGVIGIANCAAYNSCGTGVVGEGPVGVHSLGFLEAESSDGGGAGSFYSRGVFDGPTPASLTVTADQQPASVGPVPIFQTAVFPATGVPLNLMTLYQSGDLYISGKLVEGEGSMAAMHSRQGKTVGMFASRTSEQTVEDVGEAQLTNGEAIVKLDATFASTLDAAIPYVVFITPEGESKQLYVSNRTLSAFHVRESEAARGSLSFAYRVVGYPAGGQGRKRLPNLGASVEYVASRARNAFAKGKPQSPSTATHFTLPREPASAKWLPASPALRP